MTHLPPSPFLHSAGLRAESAIPAQTSVPMASTAFNSSSDAVARISVSEFAAVPHATPASSTAAEIQSSDGGAERTGGVARTGVLPDPSDPAAALSPPAPDSSAAAWPRGFDPIAFYEAIEPMPIFLERVG